MKHLQLFILVVFAFALQAQKVEYIENEDGTFTEVVIDSTTNLTAQEKEAREKQRFEDLLRINKGRVRLEIETDNNYIEYEKPKIIWQHDNETGDSTAVRLERGYSVIDTVKIGYVLDLADYEDDDSEIERAKEDVDRARQRLKDAQDRQKLDAVNRRKDRKELRAIWKTRFKKEYNAQFKKKK